MESLLWSRRRTAEALDVSLRTVDALARAGELKAIKIGSRVMFRPEEVEAFVKKGRGTKRTQLAETRASLGKSAVKTTATR